MFVSSARRRSIVILVVHVLIAKNVVMDVVLLGRLTSQNEGLGESTHWMTVVREFTRNLNYDAITKSRLSVNIRDLRMAIAEIQLLDLIMNVLLTDNQDIVLARIRVQASMGEARMLVIKAIKEKNTFENGRRNRIFHLPVQMVGRIVEKGIILANEFASNNKRRWFGLHYHGTSYDTLFFSLRFGSKISEIIVIICNFLSIYGPMNRLSEKFCLCVAINKEKEKLSLSDTRKVMGCSLFRFFSRCGEISTNFVGKIRFLRCSNAAFYISPFNLRAFQAGREISFTRRSQVNKEKEVLETHGARHENFAKNARQSRRTS